MLRGMHAMWDSDQDGEGRGAEEGEWDKCFNFLLFCVYSGGGGGPSACCQMTSAEVEYSKYC